MISISKTIWNKKIQELALKMNHTSKFKHLTGILQYKIITLLHPFTSEENKNYAKKAESMMMAYLIIKLRANELFNDNFECQWCKNKLMKKHAIYHLTFLCDRIDIKLYGKN